MSASHANALGVAIWAKLSAEAEAKVERGEHLELASWRSGDRVRLLELISAFATAESKAFGSDAADLMQGPFKSTAFALHRTDPQTGRREKIIVDSHLRPAQGVGEAKPSSIPPR